MIQLEVMKWKLGVERIMASVRNLERQRETYLRRAEETGELDLRLLLLLLHVED